MWEVQGLSNCRNCLIGAVVLGDWLLDGGKLAKTLEERIIRSKVEKSFAGDGVYGYFEMLGTGEGEWLLLVNVLESGGGERLLLLLLCSPH